MDCFGSYDEILDYFVMLFLLLVMFLIWICVVRWYFFDFEGAMRVGDSVGGDLDLLAGEGPFLEEGWTVEEKGDGGWGVFIGESMGEETAEVSQAEDVYPFGGHCGYLCLEMW